MRTTFTDEYYPYDPVTDTYVKTIDPILVHFGYADWYIGITSVDRCQAFYDYTNSAGTFRVEDTFYNVTTGRYEGNDRIGYLGVNPGYYLDTQFRSGYCSYDASHRFMAYQRAIICPAGYYCPGGEVPKCTSGTYETEWGRIECPAGSYCPAGAVAPTPCPAGRYNPKVGATGPGSCMLCEGLTYSDAAGATECTPCPLPVALADRYLRGAYWSVDGIHDKKIGCRAVFTNEDPRGDYRVDCMFCNGDYGIDSTCSRSACMASLPTSCIGGYRWARTDDDGTRGVWAPTIEALKEVACIPVGTGYWSADGDTEATACPAGQTTIGYGLGADEESDCGHALHVGDYTIHLRNEKRTSPAFVAEYGGQKFYGDMSPTPRGRLRTTVNNTVYSIHDDSM